jgi:lipopolysaccharide export system protein LptA
MSFLQGYALEMSSDDVCFDSKRKVCILSGNASVTYDKKTRFRADEIVVSRRERKAKAYGHVCFESSDFVIESDRCEYDTKSVKFRGGVIVRSNSFGEVRADLAVYDLETKRMSITSKGKVRANLRNDISKKLRTGFVR